MKWNDERFWGFIDEIALQENRADKIVVATKIDRMSVEDRAEIAGLLEDHMDELSIESVYQALVDLNGGNPPSKEKHRGCMAGIISNGRDFFETVLEQPEYLRETYPGPELLQMNELLHIL